MLVGVGVVAYIVVDVAAWTDIDCRCWLVSVLTVEYIVVDVVGSHCGSILIIGVGSYRDIGVS